MENSIKILKTIPYSEFYMWDVKQFLRVAISSHFPIVNLRDYIKQRSEKVKLFNYPDEEFGILGVDNKEGVFDAYTEKGKEINQAYKKVELFDLVYNPYRINVGSIGRKINRHKNSFISPAYVVFECLAGLNSEFLYRMFKTDTFNTIINNNTTGSVRQNLKYDTLEKIKIPLPPLSEQNRIVKNYNVKIKFAQEQEKQAEQLEIDIENYLFEVLGIERLEKAKKLQLFRSINFKEVDRWAVDSLGRMAKIEERFKGKFPLVKFRELINSYQYGLSEKSSIENIGYPMLRMNNINNSELDLKKLKYISIDEKSFKKYKLNHGDLLFNRTNSKELVGKTAIFENNNDFTFASYLIRVKVNIEKADIHFINYLFNSTILGYQKNLVSRQITGQANINAQEMQDFLFPLPPLKTQIIIANHISILKEQIKNLKTKAEQTRKDAIKEFEQEIFTKN